MSRKIAREELFKLLFEVEVSGATIEEVLEVFFKRDRSGLDEDGEEIKVSFSDNSKAFVTEYAKGISEKQEEILEALETNMTNWSMDRIGNVERALLKFGTYELMFKDSGHEIVVNEIVELAKKYGEEKSYEFINGVLAKIIKR